MTTSLVRTPLSAFLLAQLVAGTADTDTTTYPWGDNQVPPECAEPKPPLPYGILYDLVSAAPTAAAIDGVQGDVALPYQVTCVGAQPLDAGTLADRARATLTALAAVDVADVGRIVRVETDGLPPVERVGALFQTVEAVTVYLSR